MNNYEFCTKWVLDNKMENNIYVLDYDCSAGEIVKELRNRDVNVFGCDVFFEGGDYSKYIEPTLFESNIRRMEGDCTIPFDSESFDFVINNQVMEHVDDLDTVLAEIQRVLKPGGMVLSLFPDKGIWREGRSGIPFLHWFPKGTWPRVYYTAVCRIIGLGHHKRNERAMHWRQNFCEWLDKWTYYRTRQDIDPVYDKYFCDIRHIEDYWLQLRLGKRKIAVSWFPATTQRLVVRKFGGLVFVARKPV